MSKKVKKYHINDSSESETQRHIRALRNQLNSPDPDDIHPFGIYKIITYLCVLFFPVVPYAIYRIWCGKTEFTVKEQYIWTCVIIVIAVYLVSFAMAG